MIADFSTFDEVAVRRSDSSDEIASHYSIATFPAILLVSMSDSDQPVQTIVVDLDMDLPRSRYAEQLGEQLEISPAHEWAPLANVAPGVKSEKVDEAEVVEDPVWSSFDQSKVYIQDVESAMLSLLFHDIIAFPLVDEPLQALKDFVSSISQIYPSTR